MPECGESIKIMARPRNKDYRSAILGGFDSKPISTIKDINNTLKEFNPNQNYQSTRRMLSKMVKEGLIVELPKRGDKNQIFYTKAIFKNVTRFQTYEEENVSLREFIHTILETNPELIDSAVMDVIRTWMLDILGSTIPEAYKGKNRKVPDQWALKKSLEATLNMTRKFHALIKTFVDSDIWTDAARERLAKEFEANCIEEHAFIVDRAWIEK